MDVNATKTNVINKKRVASIYKNMSSTLRFFVPVVMKILYYFTLSIESTIKMHVIISKRATSIEFSTILLVLFSLNFDLSKVYVFVMSLIL